MSYRYAYNAEGEQMEDPKPFQELRAVLLLVVLAIYIAIPLGAIAGLVWMVGFVAGFW